MSRSATITISFEITASDLLYGALVLSLLLMVLAGLSMTRYMRVSSVGVYYLSVGYTIFSSALGAINNTDIFSALRYAATLILGALIVVVLAVVSHLARTYALRRRQELGIRSHRRALA